jgi:hypothetical protein
MKPIESLNDSKDYKEFYQHSNSEDVGNCEHAFVRLSPSRVQCRKCNLGFFDNPFDPFPIDRINKQTINERARINYHKRKNKKVENSE